MQNTTENTSFFSSICTGKCKGMCCDPWWGIISYTVKKEGGLSSLGGFRDELVKGIMSRAARIIDGYRTDEAPARSLFGAPERYNVTVREIKVNGSSIVISLLAMFAFRCLFLSDEKVCAIHPSVTGGADIRPPHCGYTGSLEARPDEKGYCRIIHAAESNDAAALEKAIEIEKKSSLEHFMGGSGTAQEVADRVIEELRAHCEKFAAHLFPQKKQEEPGRNDPCHCGSGNKYKKCHGR